MLHALAARKPRFEIVGGQQAAIGANQVAALLLRDGRQEVVPPFGEQLRRAIAIEPVEFALAEQEDAAEHQFGYSLGMGLGIGQAKGRAPAAAEHQPLVDAAHLAQPLDVLDQVPGGVGVQVGVGRRLARTALVEQQDVIFGGVELAAMAWADARARPAMQENGRLGARRSATLPIQRMAVADVEHARVIGLDFGIEGAALPRVKIAQGEFLFQTMVGVAHAPFAAPLQDCRKD